LVLATSAGGRTGVAASDAKSETGAATTADGTPALTLRLGDPQQLFQPDQLGMLGVPDMHMAVMEQPDSSYRVFITGEISGNRGSTAILSTNDFLSYGPGFGGAPTVSPVLEPSCPGDPGPPSCRDNWDADYAGANLVFTAANGNDLLMIYHGETRTFGGASNPPPNLKFYAEIGLARSSDDGLTWTREGAIVSGTDSKPATEPRAAQYGVPEPGAIVAGDYVYVFYPYFPGDGAPDAGPPTIQVARAPLSGDGAPGTWTKYYQGSFDTQPGLGGLGDAVVPSGGGCTLPGEPWPAYSTYLSAYVLVFECEEGWFFSTSTDLVSWTPPTQFFAAPNPLFQRGDETDENVILVTPGDAGGVIGGSGYVLYAHTPSWGSVPHELWMRPFTFHQDQSG